MKKILPFVLAVVFLAGCSAQEETQVQIPEPTIVIPEAVSTTVDLSGLALKLTLPTGRKLTQNQEKFVIYTDKLDKANYPVFLTMDIKYDASIDTKIQKSYPSAVYQQYLSGAFIQEDGESLAGYIHRNGSGYAVDMILGTEQPVPAAQNEMDSPNPWSVESQISDLPSIFAAEKEIINSIQKQ